MNGTLLQTLEQNNLTHRLNDIQIKLKGKSSLLNLADEFFYLRICKAVTKKLKNQEIKK
jgi:hypothetical protein